MHPTLVTLTRNKCRIGTHTEKSLYLPLVQAFSMLTAFLAASSRSVADSIFRLASARIFLALSTFVPSSRTTSGTCVSRLGVK